jgi:CheY-like chemotaxis protein
MSTSHLVLVVDSFPVSRERCCAALTDERWDLTSTGSCAEALEILGRQHVDAVVCYAHLEFPDGTNLITALRRAAGPQLPIFAIVDRSIALDGTPHGPDGLVIEVRDCSHVNRVLCNLFRDTSTPSQPTSGDGPAPLSGTGRRRRIAAALTTSGILTRHTHGLLGSARHLLQQSRKLLRRLRTGSSSQASDRTDIQRRR